MIAAASQLRRLFAWDQWANGVLIATFSTTSDLPDEAIRIMAHIIGSQSAWLARVEGREAPAPIWPAYEIAELRSALDTTASHWNTFLEAVDDDELSVEVTYTNSKGDAFTSSVYDIAQHVVVHGAHHRGQIHTRMREAGHTPPWIDYIQASRTGRLPPL